MSISPTQRLTSANKPKVWIGCLACYNEGRLVGDWVDAVDADEVDQATVHKHPEAAAYRNNTSHDELWCFDHDCLPMSGEIAPHDAVAWGERYEELEDSQWEPYLRWCTDVLHETTTPPDAEEFRIAWRGEWADFSDFAWQQFQELGVADGMTEEQARYFNFEQWASDYEMDFHVHPAARSGHVWIYNAYA